VNLKKFSEFQEGASMSSQFKFCASLAAGILLAVSLNTAGSASPKVDPNSPLAGEVQIDLDRATKLMRSGRPDKAKPMIMSSLGAATDVPKCLAIAEYTEAYGFPLMEVRRECCNKALSLCSSDDDYLLMALKARHYQFYEITRQAISKLIENARTVPQLYSLAHKAHEVSLNDVAHMALEKASGGLKNKQDWFGYIEACKSLGMEDLMRKSIKLLVDEEDDSIALSELGLKIQRYNMRDEIRYCLRKALDKVSSDLPTATHEMAEIAEAARQLNEPDVQTRAEFFVKKGNYMLKQRGQQAEVERQARADRERQSLDDARLHDKEHDPSGFGDPTAAPAAAPPGKPSTGY